MRLSVHPDPWLHTATGAFLIVYVDDLVIAARLRDETALWGSLEKVVEFGEQPSSIDKFLSGILDFYTLDGITSLTIDMSAFLSRAAKRYIDEITVATLPLVRSPYITEDFTFKGSESPGLQAPLASSHLMNLLFATRLCRPDLLVGITRLAFKVS